MTQGPNSDRELARECAALSRYLVGLDADSYVIEKYARFVFAEAEPAGPLDRFCMQLMGTGPTGVRIVDAYCSRFRRAGPAFRRLVAMLALLECRPASSERLDRPYSGSAVVVIGKLVARGMLDGLLLLPGILLLAPLHLLQRLASPEAAE